MILPLHPKSYRSREARPNLTQIVLTPDKEHEGKWMKKMRMEALYDVAPAGK